MPIRGQNLFYNPRSVLNFALLKTYFNDLLGRQSPILFPERTPNCLTKKYVKEKKRNDPWDKWADTLAVEVKYP